MTYSGKISVGEVSLVCEQCKCEFLTPLKRFNYLTKKGHKSFFCSRVCFLKNVSHKKVVRHCLYCKKDFISTDKSIYKKCCSDLCAHKYVQTFLDVVKYKHIITNNLQQRWAEHSYVKKICPICKKEFQQKNTKCCSNECAKKKMSAGGRKSIEHQKGTRSSKNEVMFADLCKSLYNNVMTNECIFNGWDADVILLNEKIAVMWNGKWHREKITKTHSVLQVQNRDKIKLDEIKKMGYTPYIIKDDGKYNPSFVLSEFEKFKLFIVNGCVI